MAGIIWFTKVWRSDILISEKDVFLEKLDFVRDCEAVMVLRSVLLYLQGGDYEGSYVRGSKENCI